MANRACCMHVSYQWDFGYSVGLAQHVHRQVIRHSLLEAQPPIAGKGEMRKDRPATCSRESYRIYLDNFDVIRKLDPATAEQVEGQPGLLRPGRQAGLHRS